MKGIVMKFNRKRGWGFILGEDNKTYFVSYYNIDMDGFRALRKDKEVTFEVGTDAEGREQAVDVIVKAA